VSLDQVGTSVRRYGWELAWGLFLVANLVWMEATQDWISIPFHFIWVSFTLLYGFRAWRNGLTWALAGLVVLTTGLALTDAWTDGSMSTDEMFEVPLMFGMFLAMMLHTTRRKAAIVALEKVSEQNAQLLNRQQLFVQNASHSLRSPITIALAHAELLQLSVTDPAAHSDLSIIVDEINRLRRLADRLVLLATVEAPASLHVEPSSVADLVDEVVLRWAPVPRRWCIEHGDDLTVLADRERLTLVLDTLIENAVKATTDGGLIELSVRAEQGDAVIEVSDDGPGIPTPMLTSVFDRFTQVGDEAPAATGFGLGLSIVKAIIDTHGGTATAANRPGGGAILGFRLPLYTVPLEHPESDRTAEAVGSTT